MTFTLTGINNILVYVSINNKKWFCLAAYTKSFSLAFGKIMCSLVLPNDFTVGNMIFPFCCQILQGCFFI